MIDLLIIFIASLTFSIEYDSFFIGLAHEFNFYFIIEFGVIFGFKFGLGPIICNNNYLMEETHGTCQVTMVKVQVSNIENACGYMVRMKFEIIRSS